LTDSTTQLFRVGLNRHVAITSVLIPSTILFVSECLTSSTHCSDVDDDINEEEEMSIEEGWIRNLPISSTIVQQYQTVATTNGDIVLPNADPSNFGDVRVKDSTNVHLGNKTFYKGQITIKQFIYTNPTSIQDAGIFDADRVCNVNVPDLSSSKNDGAASGPIFPQSTELNKGNRQSQ